MKYVLPIQDLEKRGGKMCEVTCAIMIVEKTHILIYLIVKENLDFEEKKMVIYQCNLWVVDDFKYLKKNTFDQIAICNQ